MKIEKHYPPIQMLVDVMDNDISEEARILMAVNTIGRIASLLRISKIDEVKNAETPVNIFTILLMRSGLGKDRAYNACEKAIKPIIDMVERTIENEEDMMARSKCIQATGNEDEIEKFKRPIHPLTGSTGTSEGALKKLRSLHRYSVGGPTFLETELAGTILSSQQYILGALKSFAEIYDNGIAQAKPISGEETPSKPLHNASMSLTLFSDPFAILYDPIVSSKFNTELTQRFARRAFFVYDTSELSSSGAKSLDEFERIYKEKTKRYKAGSERIASFTNNIASGHYASKVIISEEVMTHIEYIADKYIDKTIKIPEKDAVLRLSVKDIPWRAVNLAVAFAALMGYTELRKKDFDIALTYSEYLSQSMEKFYKDIDKEDFELFKDFVVKSKVNQHDLVIRPSELIKIKILKSGSSQNKIKMLVDTTNHILETLEMSVDKMGLITVSDKNIEGSFPMSVIDFDEKNPVYSKDDRKWKSKTGYKYKMYTLKEFGDKLSTDCAYSPFSLIGGVLLKDNTKSGAKVLIFDVDNNIDIDMYELSDMLEYSHIISTTSDKENIFKYRVIIELSRMIYVKRELWINMVQAVSGMLGIPKPDQLHQTQTSYGYKGAKVIVKEFLPYPVSEIKIATDMAIEKERIKMERLNSIEEKRIKENDEPTLASVLIIINKFVAMAINGSGRHRALYTATHALREVYDDIGWIFRSPIPYINKKFGEAGIGELDDSELDKLYKQFGGR